MNREKEMKKKRVAVMIVVGVHLHCCDDGRRCLRRSSSPFPSASSFTFLSSFFVFSSFFVSCFFFVVVVSLLISSFLLSLLPSSFLMSCCCRRRRRGCCLSSLPLLSLLLCRGCRRCFADSDASLPQMMLTNGSRWVVVKDVSYLFFVVG